MFTNLQLTMFAVNCLGIPVSNILGFVEIPAKKVYKVYNTDYRLMAIIPYKEIGRFVGAEN